MTRIIAALSLLVFLAACGGLKESRINPFNWFGKSKEEKIEVVDGVAIPIERRGLVDQVISLKVDRMPGGAIVHAIGLPATQVHWDGELVPLNGEVPDKGVLTYEFRIAPPAVPTASGTQRSREVVIGHFLSDQKLTGVRRIQVIALQNKRTVSR